MNYIYKEPNFSKTSPHINFTRKHNMDDIKIYETCHSSDVVSEVSNKITEKIEYLVNEDGITRGTFSIEAFDEVLYVSYNALIFYSEEEAIDSIDNNKAQMTTEPLSIFIEVPVFKDKIIFKYKNVIEHELMHVYWWHLRNGLMMTDKEQKMYDNVISAAENFSNDEDTNLYLGALKRCIYLSFAQERAAIVQSFDSIIKKEIVRNKDGDVLIEDTEIGKFLELLDYVLNNFSKFRDAAPYVFSGDIDSLERRLKKLKTSLRNIINAIIMRRKSELFKS